MITKMRGYQWEVMEPVTPTLKSFLYFLVAPTLIYRDEYPGCKRNLFRFPGLMLETAVHIYAVAVILKFTAAKFKNIGIEPLEVHCPDGWLLRVVRLQPDVRDRPVLRGSSSV